MKKRIVLFLFTLAVLCGLAIPALAADPLDNVVDTAGLLTQDQQAALLNRSRELSEAYDMGIYIIAVQDYSRYSGEPLIEDAFLDLFDQYQLGRGDDRAAASFFISMESREFVFDFHSDRADYAFTPAGRDMLEDRVLPYLRENNWYGAFNEYLNVCEEYLEAAKNGTPVGEGESSRYDEEVDVVVSVIFFCLPGVFAAAVTAVVLVVPMHSTGQRYYADEYIVPGSMKLSRQSDRFVRRTVTRTPRPKETSTPSSGGTTKTYSSGSHSGRSGKF